MSMWYHLQEIVASSTASSRNGALVFWNGAKDAELWVQILTNIHNRSNITASIAVIWCGPNSDDGLLREVVLGELAYLDSMR